MEAMSWRRVSCDRTSLWAFERLLFIIPPRLSFCACVFIGRLNLEFCFGYPGPFTYLDLEMWRSMFTRTEVKELFALDRLEAICLFLCLRCCGGYTMDFRWVFDVVYIRCLSLGIIYHQQACPGLCIRHLASSILEFSTVHEIRGSSIEVFSASAGVKTVQILSRASGR